ncbi:MAG: hypothetical protein ACRDPQ_16115 [Nocardioidaceae bacterium]
MAAPRARKRWLAARREWRAENGVSREEWADIEARHGIGVGCSEVNRWAS